MELKTHIYSFVQDLGNSGDGVPYVFFLSKSLCLFCSPLCIMVKSLSKKVRSGVAGVWFGLNEQVV